MNYYERRKLRTRLIALGMVFVAITLLTVSVAAFGNEYPQPKGALNPNVTQSNLKTTVCVSGYSATIRPPSNYTNGLKARQMKSHGLTGSMAQYEEDHLIPLSIGGHPTSQDNLWPEYRDGEWGATKKDKLENLLHRMVCTNKISLADAQSCAVNWISCYPKYLR